MQAAMHFTIPKSFNFIRLQPISMGKQQAGPLRRNPIYRGSGTMVMSSNDSRCWSAAAVLGIAAAMLSAGCTQQLPPRSTVALMEDPAVLQGVINHCNELQSAALNDRECRNAREAVIRLEAQQGPAGKAAADAEFERAREARRARDELERRRQEERQKVDPYTMPLAPDMTPAAPVTQSSAVMSAASPPNG